MSRLSVRFFYKRPNCDWSLPVYNFVSKYDKKNNILTSKKINITCIGIQNRPPSVDFLKELFTNFDSIDFYIITRKLSSNYENYPNITCLENCSTNLMMEILKQTHYILCFENPNNLEPVANSISAAIPLAFNSGCQLIIPKSWNEYYKFDSVITYSDKLLQKNDFTSKITLNREINLDKIYTESYKLISHKNRIFDKILNRHFKKLITFRTYNTPVYKFINQLTDNVPNILVDYVYNNNELYKQINEFREININESNMSIKERNIFYHKYLDDYIIKIPEAFIANINFDENIVDNLKKLSNRTCKDIIIINDIIINDTNINLKDIIQNNYSKSHVLYFIQDNKIIILPIY
jgi:hypothetical protein